MQPKNPSDSRTIMTDMVLPSETNPLNNLFGGELLARMDRAASIAARRHSRRITVTASVNHVAFNQAVPLGSDKNLYFLTMILEKAAEYNLVIVRPLS